jgi:hypothetical protein
MAGAHRGTAALQADAALATEGHMMGEPASAGPFHVGELRAQALAGGGASGGAIRDFMPEQHRDFFATLPFLLLATADNEGAPVAGIVSGPAGFVSSPDERSLHLHPACVVQGPAGSLLRSGQPVGLLGIEFHTRRRNRANGLIAAVDSEGLRVAVRQSFGNCPKYIQSRELHHVPATAAPIVPSVSFSGLDAEARKRISAADTFFVATSSGAIDDPHHGVDISHRGGPQGFIDIHGNTLTIPDFRGNRYFNTLGNMLLEPRAALLFIDFCSGDLLHLQGRTEILWSTDDRAGSPDAERRWRFHTERGWRQHGALPLRQLG